MLSTIEHLNTKLHRRWVPKWQEAFQDKEHGGYHERLGHNFKPIDTGHKRLVTQTRQLAVYAHASTYPSGKYYKDTLRENFEFFISRYQLNDEGCWRFSITTDGKPKDNSLDLYGHAFVIFTMCHIHKALGDQTSKDLALATLKVIDQKFRLNDAPGFAECLDPEYNVIPQIRRQDPHMHLFEACLFAYDIWGEDHWLDMAGEILGLFRKYFIRHRAGTIDLIEYFDDFLSPHPDEGHKVKPGHYFEWVWLLQKYMSLTGEQDADLFHISRQLLIKGNAQGYDTVYGGIFDYTDHDGKIIEESKRLWPFAEALKANALMLDLWHDRDELKDRMAEMVGVFQKGYIEERGFWTETLNRDLSAATDYMPGTTPYHLYFGIVETLIYLRSRGRSKSLRSYPVAFLYSARRRVSALFHSMLRKNG